MFPLFSNTKIYLLALSAIHSYMQFTSFRVVNHNTNKKTRVNETKSREVQIWISLLFLHWHHFAIYFSVLLMASHDTRTRKVKRPDFSILFPSIHRSLAWFITHLLHLLCCCCCGRTKPTRHSWIYAMVLNHVCRKNTKYSTTFSTILTSTETMNIEPENMKRNAVHK